MSRAHGMRSTHFFCGGGGDTQGCEEAGFAATLAINHDEVSLATHAANFPNTDHLLTDINLMDMRRLPQTEVLWGSPICTEVSPAGGRRAKKTPAQLELLEHGPVAESTWERTRATAYDILRAVEARKGDPDGGYLAVMWENVIEFATKWDLFPWWIEAFRILRYRPVITCVSSAHIGWDGNPHAPQWRDRLFGAFIREDIGRVPDLEPRPLALCVECGEDVRAVRWWKPRTRKVAGVHVGKYRQQYLYICPNAKCKHAVVEPYVAPALTAIDLTDVGVRIGDMKLKRFVDKQTGEVIMSPLAPNTMARVQAGLDMFVEPFYVKNYGDDGRPEYRVKPMAEPLGAVTTARSNHSLVWPAAVSPMMARQTTQTDGVLVPEPFLAILRNNATAQSIREPLATLAAGGYHHALVVPYYSKGKPKPATAPLDTLTVKDRFALVQTGMPSVEDCYLRMLKPREQFNGQRFPRDYILMGNQGEQTAQAGNAVSCNVAHWVARETAAAITAERGP